MRVLLSLVLLRSVISVPMWEHETSPDTEDNSNPLALNITRNHLAPNALFIPHGEELDGFDPRKPIQGAFFVSGNTDPLNMARFRFPQKALISTITTSQPLPAVSNTMPVDKNVDLDGDGRLSLSEVQYAAFVHHGLSGSVVQGLFSEVDRNKDGFLDSAEFDNIRPLVLAKAENAALRYMQSVDTDKNKMLSLEEAQAYILKEHGIGSRDVERVWRLVVPRTSAEMDALQFSKLRRRIRGMTIRLARQIMKNADTNGDGHISLEEAQAIAFEQEGIGAGDVAQMFASVDDNNDGELNAPEFADFERIVRSKAVETSKKALRVVDLDGSNTLTMDEGRRIAFEHYGFNENDLAPFFAQADENEDGHLDAVEFAGFRSVIRNKAVRNAIEVLKEIDLDGDGLVSLSEAEAKTKREDDMDTPETAVLFNIADQNKSGRLDKVELADFIRLVRLSAIRFATDHFKEFDTNRDHLVTVDELAQLIENKYHVPFDVTKMFFHKVDVDDSGDLIPAEIVDFRHEIRKYVTEHPMLLVAQEHEDRNYVESVDEIPSSARRITFTTATTTLAPTPITSTSTATTTTTTFTTSSPSPIPKLRKRISTTNTTSTTMPTTQAETTHSLHTLTQSAKFPTLLPSTRRKVAFRKHTTLTPQTNGIEELSLDQGIFEGAHVGVTFASTTPNISPSSHQATMTTKFLRSQNPRILAALPETSLVESPRTKNKGRTTTPAQAEQLEEATTTMKTRKPTKKPTATARITTTTRQRTTTTTTTQMTPTTSSDIEYEIVEIEVDENGNEILNEEAKESVHHKNGQQQGWIEVLKSSEEQSGDDVRRHPRQKSPVKHSLAVTHGNERQERRKLVKEQKRDLNLPDSIEVEYLNSETTTRPTHDEAIDNDDYSNENPQYE